MPERPRWALTPAAVSALVGGGLLALFGVFSRRPDVAALAVPLIGWVLSVFLRPGGAATAEPQGASVLVRSSGPQREPGRVSGLVTVTGDPSVDAVHLRVGAPGHRPVEALVSGRPHTVEASIRSVRTGERLLFGTDYREVGVGHVLEGPPLQARAVPVLVRPAVRPLSELPLPFRLQGLTGGHTSRRPGDGLELHDVNVFAPGDRLRRIDWPVTARMAARTANPGMPTDLYVRRTYATADATVMLVIDSRDEVGPDVETWGNTNAIGQLDPTSLDLAREAAASIAGRYLDSGDRVGLEDLGRMRRPVPPAGGRQQLQRLVERLARSQPEGEPMQRKRAPRLPSGSLIVLFSTFLDDEPAYLARGWRRSGHRVVGVDVLPPVSTTRLPPRLATAYAIVAMERDDRLDLLEAAGVEQVTWTPLRATRGPRGVQQSADDTTTRVALRRLARARARR